MHNVSIEYKEVVHQNAREWDMHIDLTLKDGTALRLERTDLMLGTFTFKGGATCSNDIQVGSTYANSLELTIVNREKRFSQYDFYGARVYPYVGLYIPLQDVYQYVALGEFNILEDVTKLSTIPVTCFDNMCLTNKVFDFSHLVFPTDCRTIFDEVLDQCGLQATSELDEEIDTLESQINSLLTNEPTCRDILAGFGLMLTKNLRFDVHGRLESFWYQSVDAYTDRNNRIGNSSYGGSDLSITGVYLEDAYGNLLSEGTDVHAVELPSSPIIQGSEMAAPILQAALAAIQLVPYRPSTITFSGDPAIQAGDILEHHDTAAGYLVLPVMRHIYKFAGTGTLESVGQDEISQKQESSTDKRMRRAFNRADSNYKELESKIAQTADEVLIAVSEQYATKVDQATLSVKVDGIGAQVTQQEETLEGLQTAVTDIQAAADGLSITVQKILDDGANKVVTSEARYTLDDEGLKIAKAGEEMSNKLDNTGMYVTRSGEVILQANNEGVIATDVRVRNYLIIGKHARFEDYRSSTGEGRTACFYLSSEEVALLGLR